MKSGGGRPCRGYAEVLGEMIDATWLAFGLLAEPYQRPPFLRLGLAIRGLGRSAAVWSGAGVGRTYGQTRKKSGEAERTVLGGER